MMRKMVWSLRGWLPLSDNIEKMLLRYADFSFQFVLTRDAAYAEALVLNLDNDGTTTTKSYS